MLDAIGPYEVLRNLPDVTIQLVAKEPGDIRADSHFVQLKVDCSTDEVRKADVLLIPGSTIAFVREMKDPKVLRWIREINETTRKTVTVCTGSLILAAAGLLKGKKATSHWKPLPLLEQYGAIPTRERIVEQGKFITSAGVSAGIDMGLYLAQQLRGEAAAKAAQLAIEYDPQPMFRAGDYQTASPTVIRSATQRLIRDALKDFSLREIVKHHRTLLKIM